MTSSWIFWRCFVSLVKFSYCSKFYVNIIIDSGVLTIFLYQGLTRNQEMRNTTVWVLRNIWRLGRVRDTKFGTNVSNEMLLNAANTRVTAFTVSELLREPWEIFFLNNHTQNVVEKLFPDPFLKNQSWAYLWMDQ